MTVRHTPVRRLNQMVMLAAFIPLAGCVSFGAKPPKQLLSLNSAKSVPAGDVQQAATGSALTILDPDAPKKLDTVRVPVQMEGNAIAYIKGGAWVDTPRHMFRRLLAETISANGRLVLDPGQFTTDPGGRLMGQLVEFGVDEPSSTAIVTYDAMLLSADGRTVTKRRFQATVPVPGKIEALSAGRAINAAANDVAGQVAAWVG